MYKRILTLFLILFFAMNAFALTDQNLPEVSEVFNDILTWTTVKTHTITATDITDLSAEFKRDAASANNFDAKYVYTFTDDTTEDTNIWDAHPFPGTTYELIYFSPPVSTKTIKGIELMIQATGGSTDSAFVRNSIINYENVPPVSITADFVYDINKTSSKIDFNDTSTSTDTTIDGWTWTINDIIESTDQNFSYTTTQLTDINSCLTIDNNDDTLQDSICKQFNTGDWEAPNTNFSNVTTVNTNDQNITLTCTDNNTGCKSLHYNINDEGWTNITFTDSVDTNYYFDSTEYTKPSSVDAWEEIITWDLQKQIKETFVSRVLSKIKVNTAGTTDVRLVFVNYDDTNSVSGTQTTTSTSYVDVDFNNPTPLKRIKYVVAQKTSNSGGFTGIKDNNFFITYNVFPNPYTFTYVGASDNNIVYYSVDNNDNNESIKTSQFPLFIGTVDSVNSRVLFEAVNVYDNNTITDWNWVINDILTSTDQNFYYYTSSNLDLNTCLTTNNSFTLCQTISTWDTITPTIDVNIDAAAFGFTNDFNIGFDMQCQDNFTPINYLITWNNDGNITTLYDSEDANNSIYSGFLDLNSGQNAILNFYCIDDYNNVASYTSETYYALLFRLVNEETGVDLTFQDINENFSISRVYTIDGLYSYDFNTEGTTQTTFFSPTQDLWFEFGYDDGTKINRQINFEFADDQNIGICAPFYQTFYQQRFVANSEKTINLVNNVSNCYVVSGSLSYVYDTGYSLTTYTIPMPYYLYTYSEGVKSYLALIDGGVPTAYNIDAIEFSRSTFNLSVGEDTVAFEPLKTNGIYDTNTIQIYYYSYLQTNDQLKMEIYDDTNLLWEYTELIEPNELLVNFYWGGLDLNADTMLKLRVTSTIDGAEYYANYYFNTQGNSYQDDVTNEWAAIIAVLFFLFGITLVSVNRTFGIFGILISIVALFLVSLAGGAWWINLLNAAFVILLMFIVFTTKQTGGQLT